jgi:hypothetical protein
MSLDVLAQHLATKGRNGDTMLVHMTPGEVHGLHALALAHGGRLTINPETGLPEANFLKKLLPMIAGAALNFFAPGIGTAIGSALGGLSGAAGSAIAVGGITGLATGSLQKGLMAGLGAYGGAGLTDALLGGAGAAGAAGALGVEGAATGAGSQAAMLAEQAAGFGGEGLKSLAESAAYAKGATPSLSAAFSAGADAAMKNPGAFLKGAAKPLMYAAAPIMADAMVPTTTGMPESKPGDTGYIRPFVDFDLATLGQGPQGFRALPPVAANTIKYPPPPGAAAGGIVALANGGWTGDIPGIGDPRRKEFEQYMASQLSPEDYAAQQTNPYSALSGNLQASLAGSQASQAEMRRQGIAPVTPGSFQEGSVERAIDYLNNINSQRLMGGHLTKDFDWKPLVDEYMSSALSGNVSRAAAASARLNTIGINPNDPAVKTYINFMDPDFETKQFSNAKPGELNVIGHLRSAFEAGNPGWKTVAQYINSGDLTPEDAAFGLGVDVNTVKQNTDPSYRPPVPAPAPEETIQGGIGALPRADTTQAQPPSAAPGTSTEPAFVLPRTGQAVQDSGTGTVTGGGVETTRTSTTPTFQLPPAEQIMRVPSGTITGGTVTGMVDTKKALEEYERTAPIGKTPAITSTSRFDGYVSDDKTYGDKTPFAPLTQPGLGTAGSISRGTETAQDVYREVGNRYAPPSFQYTPSVTGASKSAYDYLMGQGAYPTNQTLPGGAPLWKPYVEAAGAASSGNFNLPTRTTGTGTTGTTGTTSGLQRWVNTQTGHMYYAPAGVKPEGTGWVLAQDDNPDLNGAGVGVGSDSAGGATGVGPGSAADGGVGSAGGDAYAVGGITALAAGGQYNLGGYSDGGRLLRGPGDGVSDSIPATIGGRRPARLADGEFVIPARIVSELGNGSTEAGARKLYAMMDRVQRARRKTTGKNKVAANTKAERFLPA